MTRNHSSDHKEVDELSVEMLRSVAAVSNDIMLVIDREGRYHDVYAGPAAGLPGSPVELLGQTVRDVFPPDVALQILSVIEDVLDTGEQQALDYPMQEGAVTRWYSARATPLGAPGPPRVVWCARDVTSVKRLEENRADIDQRLRRIQRLQALGTLAAGVAHDFNNVLTAIVGYTEMIRVTSEGDEAMTGAVEGILAASQRASELTRSLLMFGRQAGTQKSVLDIGRVVHDSVRVLDRLLP